MLHPLHAICHHCGLFPAQRLKERLSGGATRFAKVGGTRFVKGGAKGGAPKGEAKGSVAADSLDPPVDAALASARDADSDPPLDAAVDPPPSLRVPSARVLERWPQLRGGWENLYQKTDVMGFPLEGGATTGGGVMQDAMLTVPKQQQESEPPRSHPDRNSFYFIYCSHPPSAPRSQLFLFYLF